LLEFFCVVLKLKIFFAWRRRVDSLLYFLEGGFTLCSFSEGGHLDMLVLNAV
jgi:hypothetical protein